VKRSDDTSEETGRQVTSLFEDILATLPESCASLRIEPQEGFNGFSVALIPSNQRSAELGPWSWKVLFTPHFLERHPPSPTSNARGSLAFDVLQGFRRNSMRSGKCASLSSLEDASTGSNVVHPEALIYVSETEIYRSGDAPLFGWLRPRRTIEVIHYAPYFPGAENHSQSFPRLSL